MFKQEKSQSDKTIGPPLFTPLFFLKFIDVQS
jgi:hypothetical protein